MENGENNNSRVVQLENSVKNFTKWVIQKRWLVVAGTLVLALLAGSGGQFLTFNNDYHIYFDGYRFGGL